MRGPGTLVQGERARNPHHHLISRDDSDRLLLLIALEILPDGSFVSAADTKRIDSGACGAI